MGRVECLVFLTHGIDLHISQGTVVTFSAVVDRLTISYSVTVCKLHSGFCVYEKLFKSAVRLTFLRHSVEIIKSVYFSRQETCCCTITALFASQTRNPHSH